MSAILPEVPQPSVTEIRLEITEFCSNLPGVNELRFQLGTVAELFLFVKNIFNECVYSVTEPVNQTFDMLVIMSFRRFRY